VDTIEIVRNAIIKQLLNGENVNLKQETPVDSAFVREIAPNRLGSKITASSTEIAGADFEFESPGDKENQSLLHISIWIFSYHNNETALRRANAIKGFCKGHCFRTKLLTIFSTTVVANKIIIIFTENSGNENITSFVKSAPKLFDK
jgi:hypothetical protein